MRHAHLAAAAALLMLGGHALGAGTKPLTRTQMNVMALQLGLFKSEAAASDAGDVLYTRLMPHMIQAEAAVVIVPLDNGKFGVRVWSIKYIESLPKHDD